MSRTDLDAHTLARSLRRMAGDGSVEWVMEPIQADVLRDIADMLDDEEPTQSVAHGDLLAECDWHDGTLFLVLPEDPERIGVRLFPSRHAPSRMYVPMAEAAQLEDENAELQKRVKEQRQTIRAYRNECDELRELVQDVLHDAMENVCSKSYWCDEKNWQTCNDKECGNRLYVQTARELGVEVE